MAGTVVRELITRWLVKADYDSVKDMNKSLEDAKGKFLKMAAASGAYLAAITVPAMRLQDAIRTTLTLSDAQGDAFAKLDSDMTKSALNLSSELGIAATDVATGFYQVLSTGAQALTPRFNELSKTALKMGKTVGLDLSTSVESLNDTLNAFGLNVNEFTRVADVLFTSSKLAATTVPQLTDAMRTAGPVAAAANVSLETTSAILDSLAESGIKGGEAGMAFKQILVRLGSGPGKKALSDLGISAFDSSGKMRNMIDVLMDIQSATAGMTEEQKTSNLVAIAGQFAFSRLAALLNKNLDTTKEYEEALNGTGGALDKAFIIKMSSASERVKLFWTRIKNLAATLGMPILEPLSKLADALGELVEKFRLLINESESAKKITTVITFFVALTFAASVLGAALTALALAFTAVSVSALATFAILFGWAFVIIAALGLLAIAIEDIYLTFENPENETVLRDFINGWKDMFKQISDDANAFLGKMTTWGARLKNNPFFKFLSQFDAFSFLSQDDIDLARVKIGEEARSLGRGDLMSMSPENRQKTIDDLYRQALYIGRQEPQQIINQSMPREEINYTVNMSVTSNQADPELVAREVMEEQARQLNTELLFGTK